MELCRQGVEIVRVGGGVSDDRPRVFAGKDSFLFGQDSTLEPERRHRASRAYRRSVVLFGTFYFGLNEIKKKILAQRIQAACERLESNLGLTIEQINVMMKVSFQRLHSELITPLKCSLPESSMWKTRSTECLTVGSS
jgi:hypothetical protein